MHFLTSHFGVAVLGLLAIAAPVVLPSQNGLTSQTPKSYSDIPDGENIAARQDGTRGVADDGPVDPPEDDDTDTDDDDDEDLIPGDLLEGDSDSGGESAVGNDAVSVANGFLGGGGVGSAALNNRTSGSTAVFCSLFSCAAAAQSDGRVSTSTSGANIRVSGGRGPLVSVKGPLVVINASRTSSVSKTPS
ncbi:hypothetical protein ISF_03551 [Cordyceps fumosorosea ARSEF 2679]|uniref:Uncharacterized protein n=1 Tax=Cordyceps fumosorosea (strain ARSEF 2679) TaxID=1081104 RepID=A0A167ZDH6_CORFA|nr:hypothetical protein ISF_03551 [Cordyceps fumosorosea ARSEF 2679]OAA67375.1 hypothetical protein ISF_03551 [Cordyceps fumosorosea ARSEF 2679]